MPRPALKCCPHPMWGLGWLLDLPELREGNGSRGMAHAMKGSTFPGELLLPQLNMETQSIQTQSASPCNPSPGKRRSCPSPEVSKQNPGAAARLRLTCPFNVLHQLHQDRGSHIRGRELLG